MGKRVVSHPHKDSFSWQTQTNLRLEEAQDDFYFFTLKINGIVHPEMNIMLSRKSHRFGKTQG